MILEARKINWLDHADFKNVDAPETLYMKWNVSSKNKLGPELYDVDSHWIIY